MQPRFEHIFEHEAFVRRLATILVGSAGDPDDVTQDTWLAALTTPGRLAGNARHWLAAVMRNLVRDRHRAATRAHDREAATARPEATPPVTWFVERQDVARRLAAAVLALDEPQAEVIVLRFYENKPPRLIAAELDLPVATVKSRLQRALEQLRERLDGTFVGGREAWMAAVVPLAKRAVGVTTTAKVGLGGAVAVIGILSLFVAARWSEGRVAGTGAVVAGCGAPTPAPSQGMTRNAVGVPESAPVARSASNPVAITRYRESGPGGPATGSLVVDVTWCDGTPAAGVGVNLGFGRVVQARALSSDDGSARFDGLRADHCDVNADPGGMAQVSVRLGGTARVALQIPRGVAVTGLVVDPAGVPVGGADVFLTDVRGSSVPPAAVKTGGDGTFHLRDVEFHRSLGARHPRYGPSGALSVLGVPGSTDSVRLVLSEGGGSLRGRVLGDGDQPIGNAMVHIGVALHAVTTDPDRRSVHDGAPISVTTRADGTFAADGLPLGDVPIVIDAAGYAALASTVAIGTAPVDASDLHLGHGSTLRGRIAEPTGQALARAQVTVDAPDGVSRSGQSDDDGNFEITGIRAGVWDVKARFGGHGDLSQSLTFDGVSVVRWDPEVDRGASIKGLLVSEDGIALSGWRVYAWAPPAAGTRAEDLRHRGEGFTLQDGSFRIDGLARVYFAVAVGAPGGLPQFTTTVARGVRPSEDVIRFTAPRTAELSCRLRGILQTEEGRPIGGARVEVRAGTLEVPSGGASELSTDLETGSFQLDAMPPGRAFVSIEAPGHARWHSAVRELQRGETWDLGVVRLIRPGQLTVSVKAADGTLLDDAQMALWLFEASGEPVMDLLRFKNGTGSLWLTPGRYDFSCHGESNDPEHLRAAVGTVTITKGEVVNVDASLVTRRIVGVTIEVPDGLPSWIPLSIRARNAGGKLGDVRSISAPPLGCGRAGLALPPGKWTLTVAGAQGLAGQALVTVPGEDVPVPAVSISVR